MINKETVKQVASLARLHIADDQLEAFTKSLEGILGYVDQLSKVDVSKVKPTTHVLQLENVYREDKVKPSLTQQEALSIAVEKHGGSFTVPKVIE